MDHSRYLRITVINTFLISLVWANGSLTEECTTGLATSDATANRRALLWKNRDSSFEKNQIAYFKTKGVQYLGIINTSDTTQVWTGVNSHGFAIMNAEALDMAVPGEKTQYDDEGYFMKTALMLCRSVDDFEIMLKMSDPIGRKVTSNFGVIDSTGRAVFFEVGNREYFRFDADKTTNQFAIRANFAFKARSAEGYGRHRFARAEELFSKAKQEGILNSQYVISHVANDLYLADTLRARKAIPAHMHKTSDTVNRFRTVASAVFESVRPGEDPQLTTFWIALGEPAVSISIPLWTLAGNVPDLLEGNGDAPLNREFRRLKKMVYPDTTEPNIIDIKRTQEVQKSLSATQQKIFKLTENKLIKWRRQTPDASEVAAFQNKMAKMAYRAARAVGVK